jgi:hypothetical protein
MALLGLSLSLTAQEAPVQVAGVALRLGMSKKSVLEGFAGTANVLAQSQAWAGRDVYAVAVYGPGDVVKVPGLISFESGVLRGIFVPGPASDEKIASDVVKGIYSTVAAGIRAGLVDIQTSRNEDANNPAYKITMIFKDREVVVSTRFSEGKENTSIVTYYPRRLTWIAP